MKALEILNRIAVIALIAGFAALLHDHLDSADELADIRYAIEQAKQGERFTAGDGRILCRVVAEIRPDLAHKLPPVCRAMTQEPGAP